MKAIYRFLTGGNKDLGILLLRLGAGSMMMSHGITKLMNFSQMAETFYDPIGLGPKFALTLIILAEAGASMFVILGALTRLAVLPLMIGMIVAVVSHGAFSFGASEMALLYLLIFTVILITGPGKYSVDANLGKWFCKGQAAVR